MTTPNDPTMSHDSLDAGIACYMLAVKSGEDSDRQELLDRHDDLLHREDYKPADRLSIVFVRLLREGQNPLLR